MSNSNVHSGGEAHGSVRSYLIGFALSVILTAASFFIVMGHGMETSTAILLIATLALIQVVVHLVYFLHLNASSEQSWNVMAFGFTVMTAVVLIGGSIWIMHNVSMNMMSR
ncbi:cytochrome o ubiquinol oxidase subunit IV [Burkholderia sp. PAMC 28687]|uniref:cytochrome o ubiquinol oxidase subunit IV n=1 Tax=Burkholderia sp. PAMC 28687 TaxID=1795874 RepID=UPI0007820FD8|nr:cytochrome o ubiquinol oxidase subunit IV [Burkholderia sp. PAMC 28687]AMM17474.1 cytochrome o ubiquinol oxidase subunit IV [Burkholderia sp. PAMC 28687]